MSDLALERNVQAAKFIASYLIGKPPPARATRTAAISKNGGNSSKRRR
jgi:hypothetical protein